MPNCRFVRTAGSGSMRTAAVPPSLSGHGNPNPGSERAYAETAPEELVTRSRFTEVHVSASKLQVHRLLPREGLPPAIMRRPWAPFTPAGQTRQMFPSKTHSKWSSQMGTASRRTAQSRLRSTTAEGVVRAEAGHRAGQHSGLSDGCSSSHHGTLEGNGPMSTPTQGMSFVTLHTLGAFHQKGITNGERKSSSPRPEGCKV